MDQDSFRRLLQNPEPGSSTPGSSSTGRGSLLKPSGTKAKTVDASQPAFKPRKVKKSADSTYRDRAAERRDGQGNDYAQVEAVLEDFERRNANNTDKTAVEQQRRYLGGDSDHTVLVKGLDMALVEQYKAKEAISTEDDDSLEQAFLESSKNSAAPKKRTREEIIQQLKSKRLQGKTPTADTEKSAEAEARLLEEAKKQGKFKPIGWKPVGGSGESKKRSKSDMKEGERKKKKRKVNKGDGTSGVETGTAESVKIPSPSSIARDLDTQEVPKATEPVPEPPNEDFDIFADAGEYQELDLGDDDDDDDDDGEDGELRKASDTNIDEEEPTVAHRWIPTDEESTPAQPTTEHSAPLSEPSKSRSPVPKSTEVEDGEEERPVRLQPLESSAVPSIKDLLAMDQATAAWEKKKKKKEKKKAGSGVKGDDSDG